MVTKHTNYLQILDTNNRIFSNENVWEIFLEINLILGTNNSPKSTTFRTDQARDNITIVKISTQLILFLIQQNYVSFYYSSSIFSSDPFYRFVYNGACKIAKKIKNFFAHYSLEKAV